MSNSLTKAAILALALIAIAEAQAQDTVEQTTATVKEAKCIKVAQETSLAGGAVGGTAGAVGGAVLGEMAFGKSGGWLGGLAGGALGGAIGSQGASTYNCKILASIPDKEGSIFLETLSNTRYQTGQELTVIKQGTVWTVF